ncbi:hypothetical protein C455_16735 [Haloferax larsenii JCM 13917]|nr:hypothetical protein C455_16735 [Haloferax larsenii JCM 13917]
MILVGWERKREFTHPNTKYSSKNMTEEAHEPSKSGRIASYWDEGGLVICDTKEPRAWIWSDTLLTVGAPVPKYSHVR